MNVCHEDVHDYRGPKFELVATGALNLQDVDDIVRTFDLKLEVQNGRLLFYN